MTLVALILTICCEHIKHNAWLVKSRAWFKGILSKYVEWFINTSATRVRSIWLLPLAGLSPIIFIMLILKLLAFFDSHGIIYMVITIALFVLTTNVFAWKDKAKQVVSSNEFIDIYATEFFVPLLWFILLPGATGPVCYMALNIIAEKLHSEHLDSHAYTEVLDIVLFYVNVIPYALLVIFIACTGNFDEVVHFLMHKKKNSKISFYFLKETLHEVLLVSIGRKIFDNSNDEDDAVNYNFASSYQIDSANTPYFVAILYRVALFFLVAILVVFISRLF